MAFPERYWFGVAKGWKDRGKVSTIIGKDGNTETYSGHTFCRTRAHIGIEGEDLFQFCPKCLIKLDN